MATTEDKVYETIVGRNLAEEREGSVLAEVEAEENKKKEENLRGRLRSAMDNIGDPANAPDPNVFDYEKEYLNGNGLKADKDGNVQMNVSNFKPYNLTIGGIDAVTGDPVAPDHVGFDPIARKAITEINNYKFNTKNGIEPSAMSSLAKIAAAMRNQGKTYDQFIANVPPVFNDASKAIAWKAAENAADIEQSASENLTNWLSGRDFDSKINSRLREKGLEPDQVIESGITEYEQWVSDKLSHDIASTDDLRNHEAWMKAAETYARAVDPEQELWKDPDKLFNESLWLMSQARYNMTALAVILHDLSQIEDPEALKSFIYMMDQYDAVEDTSWSDVGRGFVYTILDPANWLSAGAGAIATRASNFAVKSQVKNIILKLLAGSITSAAVDASVSGAADVGLQSAEIDAGKREEIDLSRTGQVMALQGVISAGISLPIDAFADDLIRGAGIAMLKKGWHNIKRPGPPGPVPGGPRSQIGAIGNIEQLNPRNAERAFGFRSIMLDRVQKEPTWQGKSSIKISNVRQKLKEWSDPQKVPMAERLQRKEIDWSEVEMFLNQLESGGRKTVSRKELEQFIEESTPLPEILPVGTGNVYSSYGFSKNNDMGYGGEHMYGYGETLIGWRNSDIGNVDSFLNAHFSEIVERDTVIAGHLRGQYGMSYGNSPAVLYLEAQSDIAKHQVITIEPPTLDPNAIAHDTVRVSTFDGGSGKKTRVGKKVIGDKIAAKRKEITNLRKALQREIAGIDFSSASLADIQRMDPDVNWPPKARELYQKLNEAQYELENLMAARRNIGMHGRTYDASEADPHAVSGAPFTPLSGRDRDYTSRFLLKSMIVDAKNKGKRYVMWSSDPYQVRMIERWNISGSNYPGEDAIINFYTKDLPNAAKKYKIKVNKAIPDQYKDGLVLGHDIKMRYTDGMGNGVDIEVNDIRDVMYDMVKYLTESGVIPSDEITAYANYVKIRNKIYRPSVENLKKLVDMYNEGNLINRRIELDITPRRYSDIVEYNKSIYDVDEQGCPVMYNITFPGGEKETLASADDVLGSLEWQTGDMASAYQTNNGIKISMIVDEEADRRISFGPFATAKEAINNVDVQTALANHYGVYIDVNAMPAEVSNEFYVIDLEDPVIKKWMEKLGGVPAYSIAPAGAAAGYSAPGSFDDQKNKGAAP